MDAEVRRAYAVLELTPPVSADALRKQYRRLAKRWHPDRHASDPAAHADATDRMRRINDAFRLVASSLEQAMPAAPPDAAAPPRRSWAGTSRTGSRMSREEIEEMVSSINRSNDWTLWPSVSRQRWYSLGAMMVYFVSAATLPRPAARVAALGLILAWIPLCVIWMADAEVVPLEARRWLRRLGWAFLALPLAFAVMTWLF